MLAPITAARRREQWHTLSDDTHTLTVMCGIAGILRVHPPGAPVPRHEEAIPEAWLDILDESIKHRGPDGQGRFRDRAVRGDGAVVDVGLVHRRMSIIDLAGGRQPMVSETGRSEVEGSLVAVVFNGCIYNHHELRSQLQSMGHRFTSDHSDTEVLIHGWREWRADVVEHVEGMYAFSIWDRSRGVLFTARDPCGEKPLYEWRYMSFGPEITLRVFSSCISGLKTLQRSSPMFKVVQAPPRLRNLTRWIRNGFASGHSHSAHEMPPERWSVLGQVLQRCRKRPLHDSGEPSWLIWPGPRAPSFYEKDTAPEASRVGTIDGAHSCTKQHSVPPLSTARLDTLLSAAVLRRMEADVPLGCFLSGGVDSSLVAHYAHARHGSLHTFCMRMPDARYDESAWAETVARRIGSHHTTLDVAPRPAEDLVDLIDRLGLPFGDSSLLPTYWLCRAAREHVKVALSGDGGDELFVGYERYRGAEWIRRAQPLLACLNEALPRAPGPKDRLSKLARLAEAAAFKNQYDLLAIFPTPDLVELIGSKGARRGITPRAGAAAFRSWDVVDYLPFDLLRKSDTASMHTALEVRAPFLDSELMIAALSTPLKTLMPRGQRKGLLRAVARKYFPSEIVDRPKMGFAIPIGEWFRTDYGGMKTLLLDALHSADPFPASKLGLELNRKFIERMLDEHMSGKRDHSQRLYMLLVLAIWARTL